MSISLYMDEQVPKAITLGLRQRYVDVLTAQEDNQTGTPDSVLLDRATVLKRVIFSQDDDFLAEAHYRQAEGIHFVGVIYAHQQNISIGDCVRDLELIAKVCDPSDCANRVQYLPSRGDNPVQPPPWGGVGQNMVKKDGVAIVNNPYLIKMLPKFYHTCFEQQLKRTQYLTLQILVFLLQAHKYVSIERLATVMPYPVLFESRRRSIQIFLILPQIKIELLWFPIIKHIVKSYLKTTRVLTLTIDRTQWRDQNIFVISLIWDKRAIPVFWQILSGGATKNTKSID